MALFSVYLVEITKRELYNEYTCLHTTNEFSYYSLYHINKQSVMHVHISGLLTDNYVKNLQKANNNN